MGGISSSIGCCIASSKAPQLPNQSTVAVILRQNEVSLPSTYQSSPRRQIPFHSIQLTLAKNLMIRIPDFSLP